MGGKNINFTGLGTDTLSVVSDSDMNLTNSQLAGLSLDENNGQNGSRINWDGRFTG